MGRRGNQRQGRRQRWRREGRPRYGRGRRRSGADGRGGGGGILITIILIAAIAFGVWYFVLRDDDGSDVTPTVTRSPTVSVSVTSSPEG
jgi:hypothetical protein